MSFLLMNNTIIKLRSEQRLRIYTHVTIVLFAVNNIANIIFMFNNKTIAKLTTTTAANSYIVANGTTY